MLNETFPAGFQIITAVRLCLHPITFYGLEIRLRIRTKWVDPIELRLGDT